MTSRLRSLWDIPAVRGVSSFSFMRYGTKLFTLLRLIIVARLLEPRDLGLFGLSLLVVAVAEVFTETGINLVLLKHPQKLLDYLDTAWAVSLLRGVVISILLLLTAPFIARFYQDSAFIGFLRFAALIPLLRGLINPAEISFQQKLQFEKESVFRIGLQSLDIFSGLILAVLLHSAMGLLFGVIIGVVAEVIFSFVIFRPWPSLRRVHWGLVKNLYSETKFIIGHSILNYLTENADDFLVGRLLGTTGLGLYQTAYNLSSSATIDLGSIIGQTVYPIYADEQRRKTQAIRLLWLRSSLILAAFFVLEGLILIPSANVLVVGLLGQKWAPIVPAIRILFFSGVLKAFMNAWNPLPILADKIQHFIVVNAIVMVVMLVGIWTFSPLYGVSGASWGVLISLVIVQPYVWWIIKISLKRLNHG